LDLFYFTFISHTFSALVIQHLPEFLDGTIVIAFDLFVVIDLLHLFIQNSLQLSDDGFIRSAFISFLLNLALQQS